MLNLRRLTISIGESYEISIRLSLIRSQCGTFIAEIAKAAALYYMRQDDRIPLLVVPLAPMIYMVVYGGTVTYMALRNSLTAMEDKEKR
jgi:hypothetical protein